MTFQRPATDRQLTFQMIAQTARIPVNEVGGVRVVMHCILLCMFFHGASGGKSGVMVCMFHFPGVMAVTNAGWYF